MTRVRVRGFTISVDGYGAGSEQSLEHPLGKQGEELHKWLVETRTFHAMTGKAGGSSGTDDRYAAAMLKGAGAFILGRNMFGPIRGPWPDASWKGWWGDNPPYHAPVFVLTHYPRASLEMEGGTTFHFVAEGIEAALERATEASDGLDVNIMGGVSTLRQYLVAGRIDEMHLAVSPILLGRGEALFAGLDLPAMGWSVTERTATDHAMHIEMRRD
jgi:dihydrofolate reductase